MNKLEFARTMSHAGHWLNIARRMLAYVRAYLDSGQYGECRDTEQLVARLSAGLIELNWDLTE